MSSPSSAAPTSFGGFPDASVNRGAIDWRNGLLAYGCQSLVCIVDPAIVEQVQTLDGHKAKVTIVRWAPQGTVRCTLVDESRLLASADAAGQCAVWDVRAGAALCWLGDAAQTSVPAPIRQLAALKLHWLPSRPDVLLYLQAPSTLGAYQIQTPSSAPAGEDSRMGGTFSLPDQGVARATRLWRLELNDHVHGAAFDAHGGGRVVLHSGRGHLVQFGPLLAQAPPQRLSLHERAIDKLGGGGTG